MDANTKKILAENKTIRIMYENFMEHFKDENKSFAAINNIAEKVKEPGCKLIPIDDMVFLITVSASHMVEMHAMIGGNLTEAKKLKVLEVSLEKLFPMLKDLGVKMVYTYMPPDKIQAFRGIIKKHKFFEKPAEIDGKKVVAVYAEV
jgi:hypothetical protein